WARAPPRTRPSECRSWHGSTPAGLHRRRRDRALAPLAAPDRPSASNSGSPCSWAGPFLAECLAQRVQLADHPSFKGRLRRLDRLRDPDRRDLLGQNPLPDGGGQRRHRLAVVYEYLKVLSGDLLVKSRDGGGRGVDALRDRPHEGSWGHQVEVQI